MLNRCRNLYRWKLAGILPFLRVMKMLFTGFRSTCQVLVIFTLLAACSNTNPKERPPVPDIPQDTASPEKSVSDHTTSKPLILPQKAGIIETGIITPDELLTYARTLIGIPYLYASTDPAKGFDCSGFVTHVFNHFNIAVPRSSIDFTNMGTEVDTSLAQPGDLILFTGTDSTTRHVGHMGIVESNSNGKLNFIHSTSGKLKGVVITPFERYYRKRFVKVIRVFPEGSW